MRVLLTNAVELISGTSNSARFVAISFIMEFLYLFEDDHASKENLIEKSDLVKITCEQLTRHKKQSKVVTALMYLLNELLLRRSCNETHLLS